MKTLRKLFTHAIFVCMYIDFKMRHVPYYAHYRYMPRYPIQMPDPPKPPRPMLHPLDDPRIMYQQAQLN